MQQSLSLTKKTQIHHLRNSPATVLKRRTLLCAQSQTSESWSGKNKKSQVLDALSTIIDPDLDENIVEAGFIKDLEISGNEVSFTVELTTPACPIKAEFQQQCQEKVGLLDWVQNVEITMTANTVRSGAPSSDRPGGLKDVAHILGVYSCKGGVGKSTVAVNLAYSLTQMGAKVGIFDADVYGPSLPTMVTPKHRVLEMDPITKEIQPADYHGVKLVSFGFAGQGKKSPINPHPLLFTCSRECYNARGDGKLDYLVIDFPPGTGDIQLTLCQTVALSAAVVVTTPQKLSFIDVAKGIRMFARLVVPCIAIVENMSFFEADGKTYYPFGTGSGDRIQSEFGLKHLIRFPIVPDLSLSSDDGEPLVVSEPTSQIGRLFTELGVVVVQEIAKLSKKGKSLAIYDETRNCLRVKLPEIEFCLDPKTVRENDTSAKSISEWTRNEEALSQREGAFEIQSVSGLGNYAVQILWKDGFNQVAAFDLLMSLPHLQPVHEDL
eukprot:g552.t1